MYRYFTIIEGVLQNQCPKFILAPAYAQNYAQSIGLTLDETATECWDNPISANANSKNIGADIENRLNRYKSIEGFTAVWIWAKKVSDTQYEIYIGYA